MSYGSIRGSREAEKKKKKQLWKLIRKLCKIQLVFNIILRSHSKRLIFFHLFSLDPYEFKWQFDGVTNDKCKNQCDLSLNASCTCGLVYGDYKCACPRGFYGSGKIGDCKRKLINHLLKKRSQNYDAIVYCRQAECIGHCRQAQ